MVKFGRHIQFYLDNEHNGSDLYIVPYNNLRDEFITAYQSKRITQECIEQFESQVRSSVNDAGNDFQRAMTNVWGKVFAKLIESDHDNNPAVDQKSARGATPDLALRMYISNATVDESKELLKTVRDIHAAALINAEALRKIVKKFEKRVQEQQQAQQSSGTNGNANTDNNDTNRKDKNTASLFRSELLSAKLLPEVYAASFTIGQSTLEAGLTLIRSKLHLDDDNGDDDINNSHSDQIKERAEDSESHNMHATPWELDENYPKHSHTHHPTTSSPAQTLSRMDSHAELISRRKAEFEWLRSMISSCSQTEIAHLVAHRGFHSPHDRSDRRPLENSLTAYEAAWTSGLKLCECDVALTKDEKLILAHDDDYSRLALDPHSDLSKCKVSDLTFRDIMSLPLKSGSRPPLLIDVLRSARAIGDDCQLIIEIKPGNSEAATALARMFIRHPELMAKCAVVMSFDVFAMHNLRRELKVWTCSNGKHNSHGSRNHGSVQTIVSIPTAMSLGNFYDIEEEEKVDNIVDYNVNNHGSGFGYQHNTHESSDHFGVGLSTSFGNLHRDSFHFSPFQGGGNDGERNTPAGTMVTDSSHMPATGEHGPNTDIAECSGDGSAGAMVHHEKRHAMATKIREKVPKLMVLTVADPPKNQCELWADVKDLSPVHNWIKSDDGNLDGVYLQFQREMLSPEGAQEMRRLLESSPSSNSLCDDNGFDIGVWGHNGRDPDDFETFHKLVTECGVSYVNSDLPRKFKK